MVNEDVVINGTNGGILIRLNMAEDFNTMKKQLIEKVRAIDGSLMGSSVEIDIGKKYITRSETAEIAGILAERGLEFIGILGRKGSGPGKPSGQNEQPLLKIQARGQEYKFSQETVTIRRNLRSGQKVEHKGNIVVLGDINPGAEVVAGGNILVMGILRGLAHAGAQGDIHAAVAALRLQPTQLRIANHITRAPDGETVFGGKEPEIAHIKDGRVVIERFKI